jgi:predicted nucleotidyltransferase
MLNIGNTTISETTIADFCQRHHVRKLALFGSILRDDFRPDSDVDVLVEFEPGARISLFDAGGMQVELSEMLGREVDLKTAEDLSRYFRQKVLDMAEVIYERG